MRRKLVVGNWKMHGSLEWNKALLETLIDGLKDCTAADYAICVPHPYLFQAQALLSGSNIGWGGQNMHQFEAGAFTGSVAPHMLADFGCKYVIIGHSERRSLCHEDNPLIATKFASALNVGIQPILCVGETREEHEQGKAHEVVSAQIAAVIDRVGIEGFERAVVAYEPVWAIGTGRGARPEQAQAIHNYLRKAIARRDSMVAERLRIIHGGSVRVANAAQLLAMPDIDGALVGNAALVADQFIAICRAAN